MESWEQSDELRIAAAQRRWVSEMKRTNPALAERLTHPTDDQERGRPAGVTPAAA